MLQVCYNLKDFLQAPTTTLFFFCSCLMFGGGKTQQAYLKNIILQTSCLVSMTLIPSVSQATNIGEMCPPTKVNTNSTPWL